MDWQPIETAPRDGTKVLLWVKGEIEPVPGQFTSREELERDYGDPDYMDEGWYPSYGFMFDLPEVVIEPTHWMPLPPAPKETA